MTRPRRSRWLRPRHVCAVALLAILGCAKSMPPPGGPIDETPPEVLATTPPSGAVNIPLDSPIIIEFSEAIDRKTAAGAVFMTPQADPEPRIKIKKDAIIIIPRENLKPNRTYVVTMGTDLKDDHNVNLERSASFAFSTGTSIDSGSIAGTVYKDGEGAAGVSLGLFETKPDLIGLPVDSLIFDYITQSGIDGSYTFSYLPPGTYYPVAFVDNNKNRRIDQTREYIGLPFITTAIRTDVPAVSKVDIQLHRFDSSTLGFRSVLANPDRLLKIRFTRPLDGVEAETLLATGALRRANDSVASVDFVECTHLSAYPTGDFVCLTGRLVPGETYRLTFDLRALTAQVPDSSRILAYDFEVPAGEDQKPPVLLETVPGDRAVNVHPDSTVLLRFSEPIDTASLIGSVWLAEAGGESSTVSITARGRFLHEGSPAKGLNYGTGYRLIIDARRVRDASGNRMGDSAAVRTFTTVGRDTLGQLSGEVVFEHPEDAASAVVMTFNPAGEGMAKEIRLVPGELRFIVDLIPGYYTVSAFLDRNANGRFDFGSIVPYRLAEPFSAPADTIRVRTRFESAGVAVHF